MRLYLQNKRASRPALADPPSKTKQNHQNPWSNSAQHAGSLSGEERVGYRSRGFSYRSVTSPHLVAMFLKLVKIREDLCLYYCSYKNRAHFMWSEVDGVLKRLSQWVTKTTFTQDGLTVKTAPKYIPWQLSTTVQDLIWRLLWEIYRQFVPCFYSDVLSKYIDHCLGQTFSVRVSSEILLLLVILLWVLFLWIKDRAHTFPQDLESILSLACWDLAGLINMWIDQHIRTFLKFQATNCVLNEHRHV